MSSRIILSSPSSIAASALQTCLRVPPIITPRLASAYTTCTSTATSARTRLNCALQSRSWWQKPGLLASEARVSSFSTSSSTLSAMAEHLYIDATPDAIKNSKGLHLLTQSTPNGQKVQIFLEELNLAYGLQHTTTLYDISTNEQKTEYFLRINPNGRIPVLVDSTSGTPFPVMETSAELLYLIDHYDPEHKFSFTDPLEQSDLIQWLFFWHGSGAPYQGNLGFFNRMQDKIPAAISRFRNETWRVFGVLEIRLSGIYAGGQSRDYLAGNGKGKYSAADIGTWTWVRLWARSGYTQEEMAEYPHLLKWIDRIAKRPAVVTGTGSKYDKK